MWGEGSTVWHAAHHSVTYVSLYECTTVCSIALYVYVERAAHHSVRSVSLTLIWWKTSSCSPRHGFCPTEWSGLDMCLVFRNAFPFIQCDTVRDLQWNLIALALLVVFSGKSIFLEELCGFSTEQCVGDGIIIYRCIIPLVWWSVVKCCMRSVVKCGMVKCVEVWYGMIKRGGRWYGKVWWAMVSIVPHIKLSPLKPAGSTPCHSSSVHEGLSTNSVPPIEQLNRQACSSHHQIVIWIFFWFSCWWKTQPIFKYWGGNVVYHCC